MIAVDGISDAHRDTWSRLHRLHVTSTGLPMRTTRTDDPDLRHEDRSELV